MKKVYVSLKGTNEKKSQDFLGVFSDYEKAKKRCLIEHSFTRQGWNQTVDYTNKWDNGHGLYVTVEEHEVE